MRKYLVLIFACISFIGFGQDLKKIVKTLMVPDGWSGDLVKDTSYVSMFGKRTVAIWKFECKKAKVQPVEFYVFDFNHADSIAMKQKSLMYYATSNCLVASNEDIRQNSMDFIKGNYYFVEKMCPCYTNGSTECRTMVRQLGQWISGEDRSKKL